MYRRTTSRAATSCSLQPAGIGPLGARDPDAAGLGDAWWPAAALADGLAPASGAALAAARSGPKVQPAALPAGAQAARPAAATRPPPVNAALRRNLRLDRASSSVAVGGRETCGSVSISGWCSQRQARDR